MTTAGVRPIIALLALTVLALSGCGRTAGPLDLTHADAGRPTTLTGPATTATPLLTVTDLPGYYCSVTHTLTPTLVVYDDGYVLAADHIGAYCEPVPTVRVGWVDPQVVRAGAASYFASREASVDMRTLPVYDVGSIRVAFAGPAGPRSVFAYGLDWTNAVPAEQQQARAALRAFVDQLRTLGGTRSAWTPTRLSVVRTAGPVQDTTVLTWPLPATQQWTTFLARPAGACVAVGGAEATALLRAHTTPGNEATWASGGRKLALALGVVLPGFPACPS